MVKTLNPYTAVRVPFYHLYHHAIQQLFLLAYLNLLLDRHTWYTMPHFRVRVSVDIHVPNVVAALPFVEITMEFCLHRLAKLLQISKTYTEILSL